VTTVYVVMLYFGDDGWQPDDLVHLSEESAFRAVKKHCDECLSHKRYDKDRNNFEDAWLFDRADAAYFFMDDVTDGHYKAEVHERELEEPNVEEKLDESVG
jgi:hypothetical protein